MVIKRCYALKYICQTGYNLLLAYGLCRLAINFNKWWIILLLFIFAERIGNHDEVINVMSSVEELKQLNKSDD